MGVAEYDTIAEVKSAVKIPVIAAGGIINGRDIYNALMAGAKGVQIGTRFAMKGRAARDALP